MATPAEVISRIDRFHKYATTYRSGQYNETQVRREFIGSLFESLGWDISNKGGVQADPTPRSSCSKLCANQ